MTEKKAASRKVTGTLATMCLVLLIALAVAVVNYTAIIVDKDNSIQVLKDQISRLQAWLETNATLYNSQINSLNSQINSLNSQINSLGSQIKDLQNEISSLNSQIVNLQKQIDLLSNETLHTNGTTLQDAFGNIVYLKGFNVPENERSAENGRFWSIDDVAQMKKAGANCLELHMELLYDWMPERNQIAESYFTKYLDKEVDWCTQNGIYCIINLRSFNGHSDWARGEPFFPLWLWEGLGYSKPTTKRLTDIIVRDFFDTDVQKQEINREAFINAWKFVANRYKDNKCVLFGIVNEPFSMVDLVNDTISAHLGITYARFMERVIDSIRATGARQPIFVDRPYVSSLSHVKPVNRDNIVWEDHLYVTENTDINSWKVILETRVQRFVQDFGKPLLIGEYGIDSPVNITNWRSILSAEVAYLKTKSVCGRLWHSWDYLEGEYSDWVYDYFNSSESAWIIRTVLS